MAIDAKIELVLFVFIFASLYLIYTKIVRPIFIQWSIREKLKKRYELTFERRDSLMYHIGHCQSNGDLKDAEIMQKELEEVDKELDLLELELQRGFWAALYDSFSSTSNAEVKQFV